MLNVSAGGRSGRNCAVTALPDEDRGERLIAFYTHKASPAEVREKLLATGLPKLWIPKREDLFQIDEIPSTATGKIDIRRIRTLALEMPRA